MKTKIFIFFALVSCFSAFATVVCDSVSCYQLKSDVSDSYDELSLNLGYARNAANDVANNASFALANVRSANTGGNDSNLNSADTKLQSVISQVGNVSSYISFASQYASVMYNFVNSIDCNACTNGSSVCYDMSVLTNIYSALSVGLSGISGSLTNIEEFLGVNHNFNNGHYDNLAEWMDSVDGYLYDLRSSLEHFKYAVSEVNGKWQVLTYDENLANILASFGSVTNYMEYLEYLEGISQDISYLATNKYFDVNVVNLTNFFVSKSANVPTTTSVRYRRLTDAFDFYMQLGSTPYNNSTTLRKANISESIQGGFANLIVATSSLNNYFYWLMNYLGTNKTDYSEITTGLANLSNTLNRVDGYVLGDFSNQFYKVFQDIDILVSNSLNKVDYTTNLLEITDQFYTNNNYLASIDSKLDVLDYIKVLSDTPLSDFSGDSYYDYLTNLYLNGASSAPSTNWFERIEILLASMVFGDSGASTISNEVEFTNFSEETIENAFNDYTFQNELNSGIDLVENTGENFLTILRGFHDSLSSVTQPQSIAIGIGGLDGQDTTTYQDVMHGHFQVSFNSGASDNFTLIVRSMTTIIWILVTMMFVYFSARWLLSKVLFFYRLMRTLITSLFLK